MGFRRLNLEERKIIQDLLDHETSVKDIAKILDRSCPTVYSEIKKNGGYRLYDAQKAQENAERISKESNVHKNSPLQHLKNRVEILENEIKSLKKEQSK